MTEKLYEINAYTKEFTAKVLDCEKCENFYKIVLDKTAFFPEGGGQACDIGTLNNSKVFNVQIEKQNIYHYTDMPFEKGSFINGKIDFERRFNFMQNHTGEHIVSGVAHKLFGVNNVGFHLGENLVTIDFDKELTREQLDKIENIANQKLWKNLPVTAYYPTDEELKSTNYRSKKEIDGPIRLVNIKDTDICACCAPHVNFTGEIGVIKLLDIERMRGGIRIVLKCGAFALSDYNNKYKNISAISALLSAKQENAAEAVNNLEQKLIEQKYKNTQLKNKLANFIISTASNNDNCIFVDDCDIKNLQTMADGLYKKFGGIRAVFSGEENNYSFAVCGNEIELQKIFGDFKSQFTVRGGGRGCMVQGTVIATQKNIELFFKF